MSLNSKVAVMQPHMSEKFSVVFVERQGHVLKVFVVSQSDEFGMSQIA